MAAILTSGKVPMHHTADFECARSGNTKKIKTYDRCQDKRLCLEGNVGFVIVFVKTMKI
jgi:hypothetical protein